MKNVVIFILALVAAWLLWHVLLTFLMGTLHIVVWLGCVLLFCYLVNVCYKAMMRQKI